MEVLKNKILQDGVLLNGNILKVDNFLNHQIDVVLLNQIGCEFKRLFSDKKIDKILTIEASGIAIAVIAAQYFNNIPVVFAKKYPLKKDTLNLANENKVNEKENENSEIKKALPSKDEEKKNPNSDDNIINKEGPFIPSKEQDKNNLNVEQKINKESLFFESKVFSYTKQEEYQIKVATQYLKKNENVLIIDDFLAQGCASKSLMSLVEKSGANLVGIGIVIEKGFQEGGKFLRENGVNLKSLVIVDRFEHGKVVFKE